jgi:hypothetical protein
MLNKTMLGQSVLIQHLMVKQLRRHTESEFGLSNCFILSLDGFQAALDITFTGLLGQYLLIDRFVTRSHFF